jgi:hypothetical protein
LIVRECALVVHKKTGPKSAWDVLQHFGVESMKIYISGYRDHWISPYTMLDYVFFWTDWSKCSRWTWNKVLKIIAEKNLCLWNVQNGVKSGSDRLTPSQPG